MNLWPFNNKTSKKSSKKSSNRAYDAASKGKRLKRWYTGNNSANTETSLGLNTLRARSRDLRRNNPYMSKAVNTISSNVVGPGIITQFQEPGMNGPIESRWKQWSNSTEIDFDGRHNVYGLQRLVMEAVVESGEVLVRKRFDSSKQFPLTYQVLEADFLDTSKNDVKNSNNGNTIVQGIEFDSQGKRVAYWLYERHPGGSDALGPLSSTLSNRIPASEIYHIYRMDRPGQARGVPWAAPSIIRLKDLDDFADATVMRQKVAACFSAFVRDISADLTDEGEDCSDLGDRIEPGTIEHLPPGKQIEFVDPPGVQNYKEFVTVELHGIAAGLGVTYEVLTGDMSEVNFSSARMGWIEFHRNIQAWRKQIMVLQLLDPIVRDFRNALNVFGIDSKAITHRHTPPRREMIDPTKEVPAIIDSIRGGITTLSDEIMAQGKDPGEHLEQYQNDNALLDELGLTLDSDARKTAQNGAKQIEQGAPDVTQD